PRLILQPMLISLLFLAVTVWILTRNNRRLEWCLPVLFALWVNLDAWFLLGPLTVAIFAVASRWSADERFSGLMRILVVGLLACWATPPHALAFRLPMELSPAVLRSPLLSDPRFERLFESPWHLSRYTARPAAYSAGLNAAGLAYFVLLGLGIAS